MRVIFDIDGTLVGSTGAGLRSFESACRAMLGVENAMSVCDPSGMTDPGVIEKLFLHHGGRRPRADELTKFLELYLEVLAQEWTTASAHVKPGVFELLGILRDRGIALGIATGNVQRGAEIKLERLGLLQYFGFGAYGSDAPDREAIVKLALARAPAVDGATVVYVGDTPADIRAARAASMTAVAVATGRYSAAQLAAEKPDACFETLEQWLHDLAAEKSSWH